MALMDKITPEMRAKILEDVGYTEDSLKEDVGRIKQWALGQPHFPPSVAAEPECFWELFLVGCKNKIMLARSKVENYYSFRSKMDWLFGNRDPELLVKTKNSFYFSPLPKPCPDGSRIIFFCHIDPEPTSFDLECIFRRVVALSELRLRTEGFNGSDWYVQDYKYATPSHGLHINLSVLKDVSTILKLMYPIRIKGVVFINVPPYVETILNTLVRPLLDSNLGKKFLIYSEGDKALMELFPKEIIPKEYGGEGEELKVLSDSWIELMSTKKSFYLRELSEKTDESKRLGKNEIAEKLHGSFRKLEVD